MADPVSFTSATARFSLPLLFAGQSQKEFFVNEAHMLADILLHPAIEGEAGAPPADPIEGDCWLVGDNPTGEWAGHAGAIASRQAGTWLFVHPRDGMRILDRETGQEIRFRGSWSRALAPALPSGGETVDAEARTAITEIVAVLSACGILSQS